MHVSLSSLCVTLPECFPVFSESEMLFELTLQGEVELTLNINEPEEHQGPNMTSKGFWLNH